MYNGPLKGKSFSVLSFCINNALTKLLLITHTIQFFSGVVLVVSWVVEKIWVDTVDYYSCVNTVD